MTGVAAVCPRGSIAMEECLRGLQHGFSYQCCLVGEVPYGQQLSALLVL